ncbi:MAG: GNAT family N-acetyltransferase [Candidatus Hadarchaeaceae archaeon]
MRIEHLQRGETHCYECWDDYGCSVIAGAVVLLREDHAYLKNINVAPHHRGKGVGSQLLARILDDFYDTVVVADIFEERLPWYRRHGFESVGKNKDLIRVIRSF